MITVAGEFGDARVYCRLANWYVRDKIVAAQCRELKQQRRASSLF